MSVVSVLELVQVERPTPPSAGHNQADRAYLKQLGLRVRVLRTAARLTQDQLAARAGLDRTYVSRLERGRHNLTVLTLVQLAQALGVSCHHLLPPASDPKEKP